MIEEPERAIIKNINFAPELLPVLEKPKEIQELRKIENADKADMQEWIDTAAEMLPEISMEINLNI